MVARRSGNSIEISVPKVPISSLQASKFTISQVQSVNLFREALSVWDDSDSDKIFAIMQDMKIRYLEKTGEPLCPDCLKKVRIYREIGIYRGYVKRKVLFMENPLAKAEFDKFDWVVVRVAPETGSELSKFATHIVSDKTMAVSDTIALFGCPDLDVLKESPQLEVAVA
jgi:hypothetical protein